MGKRLLSSAAVQPLGQNRLQNFNLPFEQHPKCVFPHQLRSHSFDTSISRTPLREHTFPSRCDAHQSRTCQQTIARVRVVTSNHVPDPCRESRRAFVFRIWGSTEVFAAACKVDQNLLPSAQPFKNSPCTLGRKASCNC